MCVSLSFTLFACDNFTIIRNDGTDAVVNTFASLPEGSILAMPGGQQLRITYHGGDGNDIVLTFSDGLPAYASEYYVYIKGDSFSFKPKTIYPAPPMRGEKTSYRITKQKLVLNRNSYSEGDIIIGYVDIGFLEIVSAPGHKTVQHPRYLRGYIKTPLKINNNPGTQ